MVFPSSIAMHFSDSVTVTMTPRKSPRKKLTETMTKLQDHLWKTKYNLHRCDVRVKKLTPEKIATADIHSEGIWDQQVMIKEFYVKQKQKPSIFDINRQEAKEQGDKMIRNKRSSTTRRIRPSIRGMDEEKYRKMKPRVPVPEAKRRELESGWKKTENSKEIKQVIVLLLTIMLNITKITMVHA